MDESIYKRIGFSNDLLNAVINSEEYESVNSIELQEVKDIQLDNITSTTEFIYNSSIINEE